MNRVLNRIRSRRAPSALELIVPITAGLVIALIAYKPKTQNFELYLNHESCPLLKSARLPVLWSKADGCRYHGPARQLLSNWKIGNLVIHEKAVIAFRKVTS
jgi:hypothetical protein